MKPILKICGLTRIRDIAPCVDAGASCLGVIIASGSPRRVSPEEAEKLFEAMPGGVTGVLVTAGLPPERLNALIAKLKPDAVQLHGGESDAYAMQIKGAAVWRAVSLRCAADIAAAATMAGSVVVADSPGGGSGRTCDWGMVAGLAVFRRVMLAGGLNPDNIAAAAQLENLWGLDVNSGVESAPGIKDTEKLKQLAGRLKT